MASLVTVCLFDKLTGLKNPCTAESKQVAPTAKTRMLHVFIHGDGAVFSAENFRNQERER